MQGKYKLLIGSGLAVAALFTALSVLPPENEEKKEDDRAPRLTTELSREELIAHTQNKLEALAADDKDNLTRSYTNQALRAELERLLKSYQETDSQDDRFVLATKVGFTGKQYDCITMMKNTSNGNKALSAVLVSERCLSDYSLDQLHVK